jgi:peptide/nickel transport system substrate-binding protein
LYSDFVRQVSPPGQIALAHRIDTFVYDEALALFLCAPHALYAVNRHVDFTAYRTTFELAECKVTDAHWSQRR